MDIGSELLSIYDRRVAEASTDQPVGLRFRRLALAAADDFRVDATCLRGL